MSFRIQICFNMTILAAFGLQADPVFGQVFNGLQRETGTNSSANGSHYFTIMGHVGRPDCYETTVSSPLLVDFVQLAGDLKPTAAGSIRIVRGGRTVQSTFFSKKSLMRLSPGDIVVVDGKVNQGRIILRGNQKQPIDDGAAEASLAITGLRDYPVVLTIPTERATIRWVTRHLGLDPSVANYVKSITQRPSERVLQDTRLATGTVLGFNPAYVDKSRLRDDLPVPVKPGRSTNALAQPTEPAAQALRPTGPIAQQPLTGRPSNQYGAAPGRTRVPTIEANPPPSAVPTENLNIPAEEQTFVKQLLTDPASVPLDEPTPELSGRAYVPQQPASPRRVDQSPAAPAAAPAPSTEPVADSLPEVTIFSPEAPRPYQSSPATHEHLHPFGTSRNVLEDSISQPEPAISRPEPTVETSSPVAAGNSGSQGGFSLAAQGAALAGTAAAAANSNQPGAASGNGASPPILPESQANGPGPASAISPIIRSLPSSVSSTDSNTNSSTASSAADGSRLLPPPPSNLNWPVISILTVGLLGAIATCFLVYSIAHENPVPRVAQINTSGRYWLDRMIENDIPIEEETVNFPHDTQLFGKPAPIQRVDAAHKTVPRPHFSAPGGKSGVLKDNPATPDTPTPDISDTDHKRIVRVHSGRTSQMQSAAAIPTPHSVGTAAERRDNPSGISEFAETVVYGDAGQPVNSSATSDSSATSGETSSKKPSRQFRLDTGHAAADQKTAEGKLRTPGQSVPRRKPATVQPSPVVVQGANLLDRILSSVEHEQTVARPKAAASNLDKRKSDERGQS
jgi:hypothetical protein